MKNSETIVSGRQPASAAGKTDADALAWILNRLLGNLPFVPGSGDAWTDILGKVLPGFRPEGEPSEAEVIAAFETAWGGREAGASFWMRVERLQACYPLTETEAAILVYIHYIHRNPKLLNLFGGSCTLEAHVPVLLALFGGEPAEIRQAVSRNGPLICLDFLYDSEFGDGPRLNPTLTAVIEGRDIDFLRPAVLLDPPEQIEGQPESGKPPKHAENMMGYLLKSQTGSFVRIQNPNNPPNIVSWLYRFCAAAGKTCSVFMNDCSPGRAMNLPALFLAWHLAETGGGCLVVQNSGKITDEAVAGIDKNSSAWKRFTARKVPLFWILPEDDLFDNPNPSLFAYTVDLTDTLAAANRTVTDQRIPRTAEVLRIPVEETERMIKRLGVHPNELDFVLPRMLEARNEAGFDEAGAPLLFETLLRGRIANRNAGAAISGTKQILPVSRYDPDSLNTDLPVRSLVSSIRKREQNADDAGLGILFWGPPGTGKTAFASYLASQTGRELMVKRYSDLEAALVGEGEKAVCRAFEEAEREDMIFLLDEADSLLHRRGDQSRRYEISMTNEILTALDAFKGIFIACTNRLDDLDDAALRRFAWKIAFRPLEPAKYPGLFRRYFPDCRPGKAGLKELAAIRGLTPGDFEAVRRKVRCFERPPKSGELIGFLRSEAGYRNPEERKAIGF